jgi:hypothetical protein
MVHEMVDLDSKRLDDFSKSVEEENKALEDALNIYRPRLQLSITEMHQQAEQWMYGFFSKLREEVLESRNAATPEDLDRYFYSYLVDKVGEAYRKCLEYHRALVGKAIEKISNDLSDKLGLTGFRNDRGDSVSEESMSLLNMLVSRSVMNAASSGGEFPSGITPQMKNILKRKRQTNIVDIALDNYDEIRNNTVKDLKSAYDSMEENALSHLNGIYKTQVEAGRDAVNQAMEIAKNSGSAVIKKHLGNASKIVDKCATVLATYD